MNDLFIIYPQDEYYSTKFLNRINTYGKRILKDKWHCYKVHCSDQDHYNCLKRALSYRVIFFMGHGTDTKLCGACGKRGEEIVDSIIRIENPDFYNNDRFIYSDTIKCFRDKIFISFSCNSNRNKSQSIGRIAITNGVKTFVGFGDIPTDYVANTQLSKKIIEIYKGIIVRIIKYALVLSMENLGSVFSFTRLVQVITTKEILKILSGKVNYRQSSIIVELLQDFKNDIRIFGDPYIKFSSSKNL